MTENFILCQGVSVKGYDDVETCVELDNDRADGIISSERITELADGFVAQLDEPVFFFLELPQDAECSGYDVYYLDNCTRSVANAIIKRYGNLLAQDGTSRFGFGSNKTEDEIYFEDYQEFMIYSKNNQKTEKLMRDLQIPAKSEFKTLWDCIGDGETGCLSTVEINGETVFDIPENLKDEGMYKAQNNETEE